MTRLELSRWAVLLAACAREPAPAPAPAPASAPPTQLAARGASPASLSATSPSEQLDRLDARTPLPLLPAMANHQKQSMREHLEAVQAIVAAISSSDFDAARRAASRIGLSEQMGQMCSHMGAAAPGFTERAIEFHQTADRITAAAQARDGAALLTAFSATLQTCTSCHAAWKQQVVDEPTWQRLVAAAPSSP
jgi:hypothetical protein